MTPREASRLELWTLTAADALKLPSFLLADNRVETRVLRKQYKYTKIFGEDRDL